MDATIYVYLILMHTPRVWNTYSRGNEFIYLFIYDNELRKNANWITNVARTNI